MAFTLDHIRSSASTRRLGLRDYLSLARQRRDLAKLDAQQLQDVGLTWNDAQAEASRPIWDVPSHWRF